MQTPPCPSHRNQIANRLALVSSCSGACTNTAFPLQSYVYTHHKQNLSVSRHSCVHRIHRTLMELAIIRHTHNEPNLGGVMRCTCTRVARTASIATFSAPTVFPSLAISDVSLAPLGILCAALKRGAAPGTCEVGASSNRASWAVVPFPVLSGVLCAARAQGLHGQPQSPPSPLQLCSHRKRSLMSVSRHCKKALAAFKKRKFLLGFSFLNHKKVPRASSEFLFHNFPSWGGGKIEPKQSFSDRKKGAQRDCPR